MYITENYIQYLVINHNGKEYKREYICLQLSHSSNNTREDSTHHQMVNTKIRVIILFAAEDGEALYSQQKQDLELTLAQLMSSVVQNLDSN